MDGGMIVKFSTLIKKFKQQGEKTGWTYIEIPEAIAQQLKPGNKKAFRVKGFLDNHKVEGISLIPFGGGNFIMALNAEIRKEIQKTEGAIIFVQLEVEDRPMQISLELMECLNDEPSALEYFNSLPPSHRKYYSNWVESAKTLETRTKRIAQSVIACSRKMHYGEMIRSLKK